MNYFGYLLFVRRLAALSWEQMLPMQMCDWAMVVIMVALWTGNRRWFEVAYFWGIGGTLQAILTPNLRYGFPDVRFISFFVAHSGIIVGVVFLMLTRRLRPYPFSIVRVFVWSEVYFVCGMIVDQLTQVNYGFLLHKPEAFSLLSYLSDSRPLYLLQMHGLALVFFCVLYLPFAIYDLVRPSRQYVIPSRVDDEGASPIATRFPRKRRRSSEVPLSGVAASFTRDHREPELCGLTMQRPCEYPELISGILSEF